MRLLAQTATMENGFVYLPQQASWLAEYIHEITTFPSAKYDDQADSTSQALPRLDESEPTYMTFSGIIGSRTPLSRINTGCRWRPLQRARACPRRSYKTVLSISKRSNWKACTGVSCDHVVRSAANGFHSKGPNS